MTVEAAAPRVPDERPTLVFRLPFVVRNMVLRWRKLASVTLGVGLALGMVITLMGLSSGTNYLLTGEYLNSGIDLYVVTRGGVIAPLIPGDSPGTIDNARPLLNQIKSLPGVRQVVGTLTAAVPREKDRDASGKQDSELWSVVGVSGNPTLVPGMLVMKSGQWPRLPNEVVLGDNLAATKGLNVGDSVILGRKRMRVSGIGKLNGAGFSASSNAYVELDTLRDLASLGDLVSVIMVDSERPDSTAAFIRDLRALDAYTTQDVLKQVLDLANGRSVFYYGISALALGISALFVGNVLSNAVAERRLEIATLRAIGIATPTILGMILLESLVVSFFAYVIGAAFGTGLGELTNIFVAPLARVDRIYFADPTLYLQIFAISIVLGLLAGFFPARSALRVQPAEALREA